MRSALAGMICFCAILIFAGEASAGDLVLSEVLYDPEGTDTGKEWVEIWNRSTTSFGLSGLWLTAASKWYEFPDTTLGAGGVALVRWNAAGSDDGSNFYTGVLGAGVGNSADAIALFEGAGAERRILDYLRYYNGTSTEVKTWEEQAIDAGIWTKNGYVPTVTSGHSLALISGALGNEPGDYFDNAIPTPGTVPMTATAPEPVSSVLMLAGLAVMAGRARRM